LALEVPFLLVVAGPNGSGKTTLTNQLRADGVEFGRYINPDEIAKSLSGAYADRVRRAQSAADAQRAACLDAGESFSFETVMSHPSKIEVMRQANARGYRVAFYFVATESADLNVARVKQRVALGGHDVPEHRIRERYVRTLALLPEALEQADLAVLFDNSQGRPPTLRPFFQRLDGRLIVEPPVPAWAQPALRNWIPL
jgi:predicted ABC-type ATPase